MSENRLSAYRIMWLFVFFDLPVLTKKERKSATTFRKQLLKNGFVMMQYSLYVRHCASTESMDAIKQRIKPLVPETGIVSILAVTDKQYSNIDTVYGKIVKNEIKCPAQLELF